tara:strand:+ start:652 stop:1974 length:1323 start_codon:yes stop_codon:yes gene_type:complete
MLDELPEGPFAIICSFYESPSASRHLTQQQLEATPQEEEALDSDYEPSEASTEDDSEDDTVKETDLGASGDEICARITCYELVQNGPHREDQPEDCKELLDWYDEELPDCGEQYRFDFPQYMRANAPHHNIVALLMLCRMACVCRAMRDLVNASAERLRNERWQFIQQDASMAFARDVHAAMERWPQNFAPEDHVEIEHRNGGILFERLSHVQAVAVFDSLIMDSVDSVRLQVGPGFADYVERLRKGKAWNEQTDTNMMQTATYLHIDRSGYNDDDRPRKKDSFPVLRVCCPLAQMNVAFEPGKGERYPMVWEASRLRDDRIVFTDCSEMQNFSFDDDRAVIKLARGESSFTWPFTMADKFGGLDLDWGQADVGLIHLKWATTDGTHYTFVHQDHATHATFCLERDGPLPGDRPIFVVSKEDVLPLLSFVPRDNTFVDYT